MHNGQVDEGLKVFDTGAVRSTDAEATDYTLISPIALRALAETCAYGAKKYQPYNAEKGMGARDLLNHALKHIYDFLEGKRDEEDLPHAMWNVGMAIHSLALWPHLNADMRRSVGDQACIPPVIDDATARSWRNCRDNLERMKADLKGAAGKPRDIREGDVLYPSMGVATAWGRVPAPVPLRFHILPVYGMEGRAAQYKADLEFEGHEVVSRWIGGDIEDDAVNDFDMQSCDVAVVLTDTPHGGGRIRFAREFGKPIVAIGPQPDEFPRHGADERWFPTWNAYMTHLSGRRHAAPQEH